MTTRYFMHPVGAAWWVVDNEREEGSEHPAASCGCHTYAKRIADALNAVEELDMGIMAVGQVYRKCGVTRAVVRVSEAYVWYASMGISRWNEQPPIVRTLRARFLDWVHGAKIVRVDNPIRYAEA